MRCDAVWPQNVFIFDGDAIHNVMYLILEICTLRMKYKPVPPKKMEETYETS